jgi:hypothetical protein
MRQSVYTILVELQTQGELITQIIYVLCFAPIKLRKQKGKLN